VSSGRRTLLSVCGALGLAAVALWVSSALVWYRVTAEVPLRGAVPVTFSGEQVRPVLGGAAPVALAGIAAVLALSGPVRRILGALLAALGGWVAAEAVFVMFGPSPLAGESIAPAFPLPPPGIPLDALRHQPLVVTPAPLLAVFAGCALLVAGGLMVREEPRLPRFGARFSAPDRTHGPSPDRDRSWWEALDAGEDPTAPSSAAQDPRLGA